MSLGRAPASPPGRTCPPSRLFADIGGEQRLPNCDQFQAGGFLQLSEMRTGQLPWRSPTSGRLVADCQLVDMPLLKGVFVGVSLEVGKVAQASADEFADRLTHSRVSFRSASTGWSSASCSSSAGRNESDPRGPDPGLNTRDGDRSGSNPSLPGPRPVLSGTTGRACAVSKMLPSERPDRWPPDADQRRQGACFS